MTLDISVVFEPFPSFSIRCFRALPALQIAPISEAFSPPVWVSAPAQNIGFFMVNKNFTCCRGPNTMHSGPLGGPLAIPLPQPGVLDGLGAFGHFFHFWNFSIPSGGPICTRGASIPHSYDTSD